MGCAFGIAACRNYYNVRYIRLPDLLDELAVARGEGVFKKVMKQYKGVKFLILDEWLFTSLKSNEARDLLEIIEARHQTGSTIFCSHFHQAGGMKKLVKIHWQMPSSIALSTTHTPYSSMARCR